MFIWFADVACGRGLRGTTMSQERDRRVEVGREKGVDWEEPGKMGFFAQMGNLS